MTWTITDTLNFFNTVALGFGAITVVWTLQWAFRISRQRRSAARASRGQQLKWRGDLIGALIQMVGQDTRPTRRLRHLRRVLGWSQGQALLVLDSLSDKGLVERASWGATMGEPFETLGSIIGGVRVRLTEAGLDEAERAESGPTKNLPQIYAYRSTVTMAGRDAVVGSPGTHGRDTVIGSPGTAIQSPGATQTLVDHGLRPDLLHQWIEMYRRGLHDTRSLPERRERHAESLLDELEDAVEAGDPPRVESLGQSLLAIAEGVVGNAVFAAIVDFGKNFPFGS